MRADVDEQAVAAAAEVRAEAIAADAELKIRVARVRLPQARLAAPTTAWSWKEGCGGGG